MVWWHFTSKIVVRKVKKRQKKPYLHSRHELPLLRVVVVVVVDMLR